MAEHYDHFGALGSEAALLLGCGIQTTEPRSKILILGNGRVRRDLIGPVQNSGGVWVRILARTNQAASFISVLSPLPCILINLTSISGTHLLLIRPARQPRAMGNALQQDHKGLQDLGIVFLLDLARILAKWKP